MVPSGPSNPIGGAQSVPLSLLRSNSGMLAAQGGPMPSQSAFSSLVSPRNQYGNMNFLGNVHNVSSLLGQSFGNVGPNSGLSGPGGTQRGGIESGAESDPLASVGNGISFSPTSSSFVASNMANPCSSNQAQGQQFSNPSTNQIMPDQQQSQQLEPQNFQHCQQSPQANLLCNQPQQQQYQTIRGGFGSVGPVKQELQVTNDQHGQLQQLQSLRNLNPVKLEPQQMQATRDMVPVKMEPQQSDQSLFLQQQQQQRQQHHSQQQQQHHSQQQHHHQQQQQQQRQQQQQQFLHMSRQSSQAAAAQINLLNQQRLLQMHQQQQQQLAKAIPQQRSQLPQQFPHPMPMRSPAKYEPGMCARRLTHYMYQQQRRPEDNNIEFWRKFVAEYFATNAKKKWCVSMYGSGRQTTGVFPQDVWHCEICNRKPGRGFEATVEVLPRLFKIKYESGTLEELLYVDMPHEHPNASGQIVLDYAKAIQESVFEQLRVVREGQLRIVFSPDLKICSWEFCARRHEELIPRRLLMPQVSQLGAAAQKYQAATQNASSNLSVPELQNNCNMFVASARQFAKALEVPLVNDLGYTKRYVRCLQISEVVNSMKDLIDYSRDTETGPMESLAKFPRRVGASSGYCNQTQQSEQQLQQQQTLVQKSNSDPSSVQGASVQLTSTNGMTNVNNSLNTTSVSTSASTIVGLLHHNSMNSRQTNSINNANSPYSGSVVQIPSPGSSSTIPQAQANPSPFQSPTPSSSNNLPQTSPSALTAAAQQPSLSNEGDPNDSQSSVQKIIHGMMMSTQVNGTGGMVGSSILRDDVKNVNVVTPLSNSMSLNGANSLMENGTANPNAGIGVAAFGSTGGGLGQSVMTNGISVGMGNSSATLSWRAGMTAVAREQSMNHQSDLSNQLLGGLGVVNGFNNNQFDWKSSP